MTFQQLVGADHYKTTVTFLVEHPNVDLSQCILLLDKINQPERCMETMILLQIQKLKNSETDVSRVITHLRFEN